MSAREIFGSQNSSSNPTEPQHELAQVMSLSATRKSLRPISKLSNDPRQWISFKQDVIHYRTVGKYDDVTIKNFIERALSGDALDRVKDLLNIESLAIVMEILEETFGDKTIIIEAFADDIKSLKINSNPDRSELLKIITRIQRYFGACWFGGVPYADSHELARHIFDQLSENYQVLYNEFSFNEHKTMDRLMDIKTMYKFLEVRRRYAVTRTSTHKTKQVQAMNVNQAKSSESSGEADKRDFMFCVRDINTARFMGYNMEAVYDIEKECFKCGLTSHYTIECPEYKSLSAEARMKFARINKLCVNCMISKEHNAESCSIKVQCGHYIGPPKSYQRCKEKHHISLHEALKRPGNSHEEANKTKFNGEQTNTHNNNKKNDSSVEQQCVSSAASTNCDEPSISNATQVNSIHELKTKDLWSGKITTFPYQSNVMSRFNGSKNLRFARSPKYQNTIKIFQVQFLGPEAYAKGYAAGDSAAEVTLVNDELCKALNIKGKRTKLDLKWSDSTRKLVSAQLVDLKIKGTHEEAHDIVLKNCYAVNSKDLTLAPRSMNVFSIKKQFPYLQPVKCNSYKNAKPLLLIGSTHAACIENIGTLYADKEGMPVGIKSRLGWSIYGGDPNSTEFIDNGREPKFKKQTDDKILADSRREPNTTKNKLKQINTTVKQQNNFNKRRRLADISHDCARDLLVKATPKQQMGKSSLKNGDFSKKLNRIERSAKQTVQVIASQSKYNFAKSDPPNKPELETRGKSYHTRMKTSNPEKSLSINRTKPKKDFSQLKQDLETRANRQNQTKLTKEIIN
jgi:hypothetical protein